MRAEFWVKHGDISADKLRERMVSIFGEDDRSALDNSEVFRTDKWRDHVLFAREDPSYRLICFRSTDHELQMHVEPVTANVLRATESAWQGMKSVLKDGDPSLTQLNLVDGESNREFMSARTGLRTELRRRETVAPVVVALAVLLYSVIGALTFAKVDPARFLAGAVPGVTGGLVAVTLAWLEARKGVLRWS